MRRRKGQEERGREGRGQGKKRWEEGGRRGHRGSKGGGGEGEEGEQGWQNGGGGWGGEGEAERRGREVWKR